MYVNPKLLIYPHPPRFHFGNHKFGFQYLRVYFCFGNKFIYIIFKNWIHTWVISYDICLSFWLSIVWSSLVVSMLMQMALFCSLYLSSIPLWGFQARETGASGKEPPSQCKIGKRHRFNPWVRKIPWRRKWQPTPVFLPTESQGQRSLVGYSL